MANVLKHRFASAKANGPDATQIQPSHWNDGHLFSGGAAGDVLTRDPTDASFGAKWTPADLLYSGQGFDISPIAANLGSIYIQPGLMSLYDLLDVYMSVGVSGAIPSTTVIDLFGVGAVASTMIILTGAAGAGNLDNNLVGHFHATIQAMPTTPDVYTTQASGTITSGANQARGSVFAMFSQVDTWQAGWTLWWRQMTGIPAGNSLTWKCTVLRRRASL